jgi:hypothetical protein
VHATDSDAARDQALKAAHDRITAHPGFIEKQLIDGLAITVYAVLQPNRNELLALLDAPSADPALALELFQNVRRPVIRRRYEGSVVRALHNYVASATTLVDHSRRVMRGRSGAIVAEFDARKTALLTYGEIHFVQGLRNFILHRSLPFIGHVTTAMPQPGVIFASEIQLSVQDLLAWDGWKQLPLAEEFIESHEDVVPLRPIIAKHADLVVELNLWLYEQLAAANEAALDEVNELMVEKQAILTGLDMEHARRLTEFWTRRREDPSPRPLDADRMAQEMARLMRGETTTEVDEA